ncbi:MULTISPECIES: S-Ena type endospore appendage [Neobacillus]
MSEEKNCDCKEKECCTCKKSYRGYSREPIKKHHHYEACEIQKNCEREKEKCHHEKEHCDHKKEKCHHKKEHCDHEKEKCPDTVKGFNLCRRRNELRCFKQCEPVSQPCDNKYYNYFTSRTNFEFNGLVVVTNTGNPTSGCSMKVSVSDRVGSDVVATVSPGASVPIFVEGLTMLDIKCVPNELELPVPPICSGEIIFDLEYCASRACF